ncbi:hypothetical protein Slin15195_G093020 [Septoria linicola]|uniref:Uncharacterized protein n=1 Tax=Septoria linicola TaxID=215465 RepID=A0A9Q9ENZ5_9PEZI|nr:hypothetical protein Slin14017_G056130 [Septoria linicola]USW55983.1 hypothetical protein Slin15195_G093020 [Septoria linicola]
MTLPQFALDYNGCTRVQLHRFIKDRTIRTRTNSKTKKALLVKVLQTLDQTANFRFMDLPAEMRNIIYELLLTRNKFAGMKAYPALLRASKQMYKEGYGVLMAESVLCAGFRHLKDFVRPGTKMTGDIDLVLCEYESAYFTLELGHRLGRLPKLSEVSLDVEFGTDGHLVPPFQERRVQTLFHRFATLPKHLRRVELVFQPGHCINALHGVRRANILRSIARLGVDKTLVIKGLDRSTEIEIWEFVRLQRADQQGQLAMSDSQ